MAKFIVEVALGGEVGEVHYVTYTIEGDHITTPQQAREEVNERSSFTCMVDNSLEYSHELGSEHIYDDSGELVLD